MTGGPLITAPGKGVSRQTGSPVVGSPLLGTRLPARIATPSGAASFPGSSDGRGPKPRKELVRQAGVAVVECKEIDCLDLCRHVIEEYDRVRTWGNFGCDFVEMELQSLR